jgi:hypothetical protein
MSLIFVAFAVVVWALWLALFVRAHRLFYAFRDRYPGEAQRKISHAFEFERSPSKFFYFMSADSAAFLNEKKDEELLSKRRSVVRMSIAAVVVPFGGTAILAALIAMKVFR